MTHLHYFGLVSLLPDICAGWRKHGIIARAIQNGRIVLECENPRSYSKHANANIDDKSYGGGPGMVMQLQPVADALAVLERRAPQGSKKILLAPHGRQFDQSCVDELITTPGILFICGRYEGIDARIEQREDIEIWSIGNFVLNGGELAAMVFIESLARHLPGVLGDERSAQQDSFIEHRLDYPHYTRPAAYGDCRVPTVLTSGHQAEIDEWRRGQAMSRMWEMRPDLVHNLAPLNRNDWMRIYTYAQNKYQS